MPVLTHTRCGTCSGVLHAGEKNQSFKSKIMHKVTTEEETPISHTHLFILHVRVNLKSGSEIRSNVPRSEATCHDGEQRATMESNVPRWVESRS
jgi:hypothetical protein